MTNVFSKSIIISKIRKVQSLAYVVFMMAFASCGSTVESSDLDAAVVDSSISNTTVYGIDAENVAIRTGPGRKFARLVNKTATASLRETHYCELGYSTKVEILERKGDWAKIKVVDPEWLSDTYIGWIPAAVTITLEAQLKQELGQIDEAEYEILRTDHNAAVQNFDVLLKRKKFDKAYAYQFIKAFRKKNCQGKCNVSLYDNITIEPLLGIYPLEGRDYLKMAEHLISISTFDATEVRDWYPYQDFNYRDLGGNNWKKKPQE